MKGKTKLRVIQILCIVSLLITVFSVQRTYAKYYEKVGTNYQSRIKRWVIKVDGEVINQDDKHYEYYLLNQRVSYLQWQPYLH